MNTAKALEFLCRNAVEVISREELGARLDKKQPLRVKAGFDPSSPDIHLGHTVLLRKLREFQDLGHKVVFIIGDTTAMIGDPTGQSKTRPALSAAEVKKNAATYQKQAFKVLDKDPKKIEIVNNTEWFGKMNLSEFLAKIASQFNVARVIERDDFQKRMSNNQPITIQEFMYPLLQAYDSVMVRSDIELGGSDQKFNLLAGRDLQRSFGQAPQVVMTMPLLVGLDGTQKMSKSYGNHIGVLDSSQDVFGKTMSIPDALMGSWYSLLTQVSYDPSLHPREAKVALAKKIVASLYDEMTGDKEAAAFDSVFKDKQTPTDMKTVKVSEDPIWICKLLVQAGAAASNGEARRLVEQGAVEIDNSKVSDPKLSVSVREGAVLKAGKKNFYKLSR